MNPFALKLVEDSNIQLQKIPNIAAAYPSPVFMYSYAYSFRHDAGRGWRVFCCRNDVTLKCIFSSTNIWFLF